MRSPTGNGAPDRTAWDLNQHPAGGLHSPSFGVETPQPHQLTEVPASPDVRGYEVSPLASPPPSPHCDSSSSPLDKGKGPMILQTSPGGVGVLHSAGAPTQGSPHCATGLQPLTDLLEMFAMTRSMPCRRPKPHGAAAGPASPPHPPSSRPGPYPSRAHRRGASAAVENIGVPREQQLSRITDNQLSKLAMMLQSLPGVASARSPRPAPANQTDRYTIDRLISQGAFAQVYVGRDSRTDSPVCVKAVTDTPVFSREHEITDRVTGHPNIVEYLGRWILGSRNCLVFGLANQGDLLDMFRDNDERKQQGLPVMMTQRACRGYLAQACAAVAHIHAKGIVHFDIKLDNFLVHDGVLKLCDFGLSGFEGSLRSGRPCGTRAYMAPELSGLPSQHTVTKSADIWGMGMVIFTMVLDEPCWEEATVDDADYALYAQRVQSGEAVTCEEPWRRLAPGLRELMLGMLSPDPTGRPSIADVAAGIQGQWTIAS